MIVKVDGQSGQQIAKRLFWLAYQASHAVGMGALHATNDATEESVWARLNGPGDYATARGRPSEPYADYVFGRMMKLGCAVYEDRIELNDWAEPRRDYQSWCCTYKSMNDLATAVISSFATADTAAGVTALTNASAPTMRL